MDWTKEWPTVEGWYWRYEPEYDRNHDQPPHKYTGKKPKPNLAPAKLMPVHAAKNGCGDIWVFGRDITHGPRQLERPTFFLGPIAEPALPPTEAGD